ncbi:MAG: catechol 2,3-dioxygenase [Pseudomonadota bacterium]|nr:catechol 2,3-dioxygenase [Pseudomonadota bacterium]
MAMTGVMRPGHVQLRVMDLAAASHFYGDVLGLVETGRDAQGRIYYKAWDERDHSSVVLRQADRAGLDFMGFKVRDAATLERLDSDLRAYGVATERIKAGDLLETGERVRFELPTGHQIELYAAKKQVGNGLPTLNPAPWSADAERGIAPLRLDHALLYGPHVDKVLGIFTDVLGFWLTEYVLAPDGITKAALWLSCSHKAHDVAFVMHPEPGKLHHVSFLLESWEKVLRAGDIMSMNKVQVDMGPTRHGVTRGTTIYAWDPSGNRFETFCGGSQPYPDWEPLAWDWQGFQEGGLDYPQRKLHETFLSVVT